jgi:hypothetical protein
VSEREPLSPTERAVYHQLGKIASTGAPCPGDGELAAMIGMRSHRAATEALRILQNKGWIMVDRVGAHRTVTIVTTGKSTAAAPPPGPAETQADRVVPSVLGPAGRNEDLAARIEADQARLRASREHWLQVEQQRYQLPRRGRLIEEMPL